MLLGQIGYGAYELMPVVDKKAKPRRVRTRLKARCYCPKRTCRGQLVDVRKRDRHTARAASLDHQFSLLVDPTAVPVEPPSPPSAHSAPASPELPVRVLRSDSPIVLTAADHEMLDAYDKFFLHGCPDMDTPLDSVRTDTDGSQAPVSVGMLIMMHLEWMDAFNASLNSATHQWNTIKAIVSLHDSMSLGLFANIKRFVEEYRLMSAKKIDMCPCTEMIYYDLQDPVLRRDHPHIKDIGCHECGKCGLSRHVEFQGRKVPRKVFWYLPYK